MNFNRDPSARKIEHVVVLMLENRSFDCMLGWLYPKSGGFDGLDGTESNRWHKPDGTEEEFRVWNSPLIQPDSARIPDPDPGELFADMSTQIFGLNASDGAEPNMSGFVDSYMRQPPNGPPPDPRAVMHCFTPAQAPVLSQLARAFGVSDRWHASAPCETWPNRYFAHCGTAGGQINNKRSHFPYRWPRTMRTIFRRLDACGYDWRIYFHDMPQAATLVDLWSSIPARFCFFEAEFGRHARTGRLANYSFIEPRYYANAWLKKAPNDQHPPHNILYGEQLIADVYNAVRGAPAWERTVLIITYDEHGGAFDHVPPPPAVPPGGPYPDGFRFDRYGVRVPAVIISPYVPPGSIIRPPPGPDGAPPGPFEHASVLAMLHELFDLGPPLTPRVAAAPNPLCGLTLEKPENHGPERVSVNLRQPSFSEAWHDLRRGNQLQHGMRGLATGLPAMAARAVAHARGLGVRLTPEDWRRKK
ncbi:MAG: alkaline phosphatase family protein [Candidatus Binataceae bacterium]